MVERQAVDIKQIADELGVDEDEARFVIGLVGDALDADGEPEPPGPTLEEVIAAWERNAREQDTG